MNLRKNLITNLILTSSNALFPIITFPYVTRILSIESYGRIAFIEAFTGYFLLFSALGIPLYGIREIAKIKSNPSGCTKLVLELTCLQLALSLFFSLTYLIAAFFIPSLQDNLDMVKVACLILIGSSFSIEWFFQGIEKFSYITYRSLFTKSLNVLSILLFVNASDDYLVYYMISAATVILNAGWNFAYFLRRFYTEVTVPLSIKNHLKPLLVLFSINISISFYTILDTVILGLLTNSVNVSFYSVPLRFVKIFWTIVSGIGVVIIPRMADMFKRDDTYAIQSLIRKSTNIVFLITIPFCAICMAFPQEILSSISSEKYNQAADALRVLSAVPLVIGICNVLGTQFLLPIGQERKILHATIAGLVISLVLNFTLIPSMGYLGASIACLAAESAVCIYIFLVARKYTNVRIDFSLIIQIALSLVVSLGAALSFGSMSKVVLLATAGMMYVMTFCLLQILYFKNEFVFSLLPRNMRDRLHNV
ncbi:flippase [Arcticibacter sp.]|jgi:O-antigen/teichoic acid export membrane protein|uniref:flippase n=1 Tax=Arcticibacter sp. TaxID=1872630 RepID=UPI00388D0F92